MSKDAKGKKEVAKGKAAPAVKPVKKEKPAEAAPVPEVAVQEVAAEKAELVFIVINDPCDELKIQMEQGKHGCFDPTSAGCVGAPNEEGILVEGCMQDFPETYAACKHNTELEAAKTKVSPPKKKTKVAGPAKERVGRQKTPLGTTVGSRCGQLDMLMLRPEGATTEELIAVTPCLPSHIATLRGQGRAIITYKDGKYFARAPKDAADLAAANKTVADEKAKTAAEKGKKLAEKKKEAEAAAKAAEDAKAAAAAAKTKPAAKKEEPKKEALKAPAKKEVAPAPAAAKSTEKRSTAKRK